MFPWIACCRDPTRSQDFLHHLAKTKKWVRLDLADPPAGCSHGHGQGMEPQLTRSRTAATREAGGATTTLAKLGA
ncbi:hypothetical protein DAI22_01g225500 [Oryza sativa Japonica Group]|nr:hypothetical protein DAI22_01g225500 [Oryza sativa Japonica Group]